MNFLHPFGQFVIRATGPHLALYPVVLHCSFLARYDPDNASSWRIVMIMVAFCGCWFVSDLLATGRLSPERSLVTGGFMPWVGAVWGKVTRQYGGPLPPLPFGVIALLLGLYAEVAVRPSSSEFCFRHALVFLVLDLCCLWGMIAARSGYDTFLQQVWPGMTSVAAARAEVQTFYDQRAELLWDLWPPERLRAELMVRIPPSATADQAWQAARALMADMQRQVRAHRQRQDREQQAHREREDREQGVRHHANAAVEERVRQLRADITQLDERIAQGEQALHAAGVNRQATPVLERQLAGLRFQRTQRVTELNGLLEGN